MRDGAGPLPGRTGREPRGWWPRLLGMVAVLGFVAYCAWWAYWLLQGRLPSAPFKAITGLPAPTTGCTRSLRCLLQGDVATALQWNAFALPITALFALSIGWLMVRLLQRRPLLLPSCFLHLWAIVLLLAWATKLLGHPQYW